MNIVRCFRKGLRSKMTDTEGLNPFMHGDLFHKSWWTLATFESNFHKCTKYLKESCGLNIDQRFFFKYLWKITFQFGGISSK